LKKNHTDELTLLEKHLQEKQKEINETDSKMTMISVYVDQLEERLATFAVARRDIAVREKECDKLVNRSLALEEEVATMKTEAETMKTEQIEMKNLVDLLIQERTELQNEKMKLTDEKEKLVYEGKALREELDILNDNFLRIEKEAEDTLQKLEDSREIISSQERALDAMEQKMISQQQEMTEKYGNETAILQQEIQRLEEENQNAINMIRNLEDMLKDLEGDLEEAREQIKQLSIYDQSLNTIAVQPPPPPPPPIDTSAEMDITTTEQKMDNVEQHIDEREEQKIMDHSPSSDIHEPVSCLEFDEEDQIHSENTTEVDHTDGIVNLEGLNEESFDDEELLLYDTHDYINGHDDDLSEPELPNDSHDSESSTVLMSSPTEVSSFTLQKRRVPFRAFRKKVSKLTGIHGFFTKPTSKIAKRTN
jgi:Chromosome segregation ATPases